MRLLTGHGILADLCCTDCDRQRQDGGEPIRLQVVCEGCVALYDDEDAGFFEAWRGQPGIAERPEDLDRTITTTALAVRAVVAVAGTPRGWLLLDDRGRIWAGDATLSSYRIVVQVESPREPEPDGNRKLRRRLHVSADGRFAAVVNDFGRYGQVIDLGRGRRTLELDGGDYHPEQVPFSVAFAEHQGRTVVIHRTAWNRLDVSDAATGRLLTDRTPPEYRTGEQRPEHYLDYFHGALHVSPGGRWIADDGWVWSPVGLPVVWDLHRWLGTNVWESEDGPTWRSLCQRAYHWRVPMCWIGGDLLAVSGIGGDDLAMLAGVRIFDVATGAELHTFPGPQGELFSSGRRLFAAAPEGLTVWDPFTGELTGRVPGFVPAVHHRGLHELAEVRDGQLLRWPIPPA